MFCTKCGRQIMDEAVICPNCGCPVSGKSFSQGGSEEDVPNGGLAVLGFFIPLAGLIMYCAMIGKTPKKANPIGICSLVGFIFNFVLLMLLM